MAMRVFGWVLILVVVFFTGLRGGVNVRADDESEMKRWVLTDGHADGSKTLLVIDEDSSLRNDPTVLSQHVVFKQKYSAAQSADYDAAKARYESERPEEGAKFRESFRQSRLAKPLWTAVKNEWTTADEDAYSAWFAANVRSDFLRGTGLNADCADVGLTFRWVYARMNSLPIANTLAGSGKLMGNFTANSAWDKLPTNTDWRRDERFKAALRELYDETYTWSINDDQFPTLITRQYVRPGSMYMIIRTQSGHTQTISSVSDSSGVQTFWGNEPAAEAIYASSLIVEFSNRKGFQNWRHVRRTVVGGKDKWTLVPGSQMPGYSKEQFETGYTNGSDWMNWIYARLGYRLTDEQRYGILARTFEQSIDFRRAITGVGTLYCGPTALCSATGANYDNYSTFSRDSRLKDLRDEMRALSNTLGAGNFTVRAVKATLTARGEVALGTGTTFYDALSRDGVIESWSADPNVSFLGRWGVPTAPSPAVAFLGANDAFFECVRARESLVQSAWTQCHQNSCTGNEPSVKAVETSALDGLMRSAYRGIQQISSGGGIAPAVYTSINVYFRRLPLANVRSMECSGVGGACTAFDVTWGFEAPMRLAHWSSAPIDSIESRWGL